MALIAPFRGLRYNPEKIGRMEDVVTPPYDVIDAKAQAALLAKNPYNMIQLDLSKNVKPEDVSEERYLQSKRLLEKWQAEGVLLRDDTPAIYIYHTEYQHPSGRRFTRKGLVALVGLAEFSEGIVKPHEKTFAGVVTDRVRLLDTCQTQFSQIFSLYPDPHNEVMAALEAACPAEPLCSAIDGDGGRHVVWAVTDPATLRRVQKIFTDKSLYIADGHHRYTTALQLRKLMRERHGAVAPESPYNHVMMYLCGMEDPGLSVLPTHRLALVPAVLSADQLAEKLRGNFQLDEISGGTREVLVGEVLARMNEEGGKGTLFGFYHPGEDRCFMLTLKKSELPQGFVAAYPDALRDLDVVVLSDLLLERILGLDHHRCEEEGLIDYFSDPDEGLDVAVKMVAERPTMTPALFLMNPTLVSQVKAVADSDLVMPHKSTFFYPKILTGLLMNKMLADERVG
ncbi:MAG: DUF1015 domain-containing protein [Desulfobulbaceae bacterium]|nr:DUF1015 domain-containing protein [Desulfobulbaceae bacterium]